MSPQKRILEAQAAQPAEKVTDCVVMLVRPVICCLYVSMDAHVHSVRNSQTCTVHASRTEGTALVRVAELRLLFALCWWSHERVHSAFKSRLRFLLSF